MSPNQKNTQNPPNPYEILGLKPSFSITPTQIQHAYLQKLSTTHPDLGPTSGHTQLDPAALNQARDTLQSDEARANLMLHLLNGPSPTDKSLPDNFLMEMMQLRTQIEEELAPQSEDASEARARWQSWANDERTNTIATITTLFESLPAADASSASDIKLQIRTRLNAWRYTERLIEQLDPTYHPSNTDF